MSGHGPEPFYRPLGEGRFLSTSSTVGPWFADAQHMGPPTALLVRAVEHCAPRPQTQLARITVEVLGRVPAGEVTVAAAVERAGRSIELLSAELTAGGRAVARARAWRLASADTAAVQAGQQAPMPPPEQGRPRTPPEGWVRGYLDALEWRWLRGGLDEPGDGAVWVRLRVPVVEGESPSPLQRLGAAADSANGVAARLDVRHWLFLNTDLTLHLHREPAGEWVGLDAVSLIGAQGVGAAYAVLHDTAGPVGRSAQALIIRPR